MKILLLILSFSNFASYLWSVIGVFKPNKERKLFEYRFLQLNSLSIWIVSLYELYMTDLVLEEQIFLCVFQLFCLLAFWKHVRIVKENEFSIAFCKDAPRKLIQKGFYKKVRHPFYMFYILSYLSIAVLTMSPVLILLNISMIFVYYRAARFEESKFANSDLSIEYNKYKKQTWMFFPKFI